MKEKLLKNLKAKGLKTDVFQHDLFASYELTKNLTWTDQSKTTPLLTPLSSLTLLLTIQKLSETFQEKLNNTFAKKFTPNKDSLIILTITSNTPFQLPITEMVAQRTSLKLDTTA